ncbi:PKD domain-containing protein, partial [Candidatus Acetothermia bacterium]|nr:PKD domain-containing protein [Candidatus Acetothermia bacterium]
GEWIRFDATASHDPDGTIISYAWDFGDGTRGTGPRPFHRYTSAGIFSVTLTVTDNNGATITFVNWISVAAVTIGKPPVATFTVIPPTPMIGETVTLNATSSFDPDGWIVTYKWDRDSDGIYDISGPIVSARYWLPGWQIIRLTVIDNTGLSATTTERIWVGPPVKIPWVPPTVIPWVPPTMVGIPGFFVWGTDRWNITINAGTGWTIPRRYRIEVQTDGTFHDVARTLPPGVAPVGIVPAPIDGGKRLIFEGDLITGLLTYSFTVPNSETIWMRLQLDIDGDGRLDESSRFIYLGPRMVRPPHTPFVVGLPDGHPGPLVPTLNFRIGTAITYTAVMRFIIWITTIHALGG